MPSGWKVSYLNSRAQQISSFYLVMTAFVKILSHLVLFFLDTWKLYHPTNSRETSSCVWPTWRGAVSPDSGGPLSPKGPCSLGIALKPAKIPGSLPVGDVTPQAWPQHCHWILTKVVEMLCPHIPPNTWGQLVFALSTRGPLTIKKQPHAGNSGGLRNRLCSVLLFWWPITDKETLMSGLKCRTIEFGNALTDLPHGRARKWWWHCCGLQSADNAAVMCENN